MLHYPHRVVFYRPDGQIMFDHVDDLGHKVRFSAGKRRWYADLSDAVRVEVWVKTQQVGDIAW